MCYIGKVCSGGENRKEEWSAIKEHFRKKGKEQTKLTPHHRVRIRKDAFMCRWNWIHSSPFCCLATLREERFMKREGGMPGIS
jgi:hypothetical protein